MSRILVFGGRGAGKDETVNILKKHLPNFHKIRLAGYVVEVCRAFGIENPTRTQLVLIGETVGRNMIDKEIWINKAKDDMLECNEIFYKIFGEDLDFVISDVRYQNEYDAFCEMGFIPIKIECDLETRIERVIKRDGTIDMSLLEKEGEQAYKKFENYYTIDNNGTLEELEEQIVEFLKQMN